MLCSTIPASNWVFPTPFRPISTAKSGRSQASRARIDPYGFSSLNRSTVFPFDLFRRVKRCRLTCQLNDTILSRHAFRRGRDSRPDPSRLLTSGRDSSLHRPTLPLRLLPNAQDRPLETYSLRMWTLPWLASLTSYRSRWQSGQVRSYVRPLGAAHFWPRARMVFVRSDPNRNGGLGGPS